MRMDDQASKVCQALKVGTGEVVGRGLHSSTFQLNLSRF